MKKLLFCAILPLVLPAFATIAPVQSAATWAATGGTCSVPFTSNPMNKNLIVVWTSWTTSGPNSVTVTQVTDTLNNGVGSPQAIFLSAVGPTIQSASNTAGQIFYAANIHGGSPDTVKVTFSSAPSSSNCVIAEASGADLTNPLDSVSAGYSTVGNQTSLLDSGTLAPANANLLLFGGGTSDTGTASLGTGFSLVQKNGGNITEYEVLSGNTALQRATAGLTAAGNWVMQMAVFRDASWTVGGGWNPPRFAQILDASQFPGVDIGDQVNHAYAALPATGGHIIIPAKADGSCYNFTTPIVFATAGKYVLLEHAGAAGTTFTAAPVMQGCLNFTPNPNTGTAITLNYVSPSTSTTTPGPTPTSAHGLRNISLVDNQCLSTSCVKGTSAYGIDFGNTVLNGPGNYGAQGATMENVSIAGFETAIRNINFYSDPITWINPIIWYNGVGFDVGDVSTETFFGGYFNSNVDAVEADDSCSRSETHFYGTSFVGNSLAFNYLNVGNGGTCANGPPAYLFLNSPHFENGQSISAPPNYIEGNVDVFISGGTAENDSHSGSCANANWFFLPSGNKFIVDGMTFSGGPCVNLSDGIVNAANNTRISLSGFIVNFGLGALTTFVGGTNAAKATVRMSNGDITNTPSTWVYESPIAASALSSFSTVTAAGAGDFQGTVAGFRFEDSNGTPLVASTDFAFSGGWGSTTTFTTSSLKGSDGAWSGVVKSTGTGQSANPTMTLTFHDGMWSAVPVCSTKINATTDSPSQLTVAVTDNPTTTTDVITFWGTPLLNDTYTFSSTCTGKAD